MITNLILWGSVIWIPALLYVILKNEARHKKNIAVGVTLPPAAWEDEEVKAILARYRRALGWTCLGVTLAALPFLWCKSLGVSVTAMCLWLDVCLVAPYVPYWRCNRRLRACKKARGWKKQQPGTVVNLTQAAQTVRWLSPWCFAAPLAVALVPLALDRQPWIWAVYAVDAAMVLLSWGGYRWLYRNRAETVDADPLRTEALTRVRRAAWGRCWLWTAWSMAALNLCLWLLQSRPLAMMAAIVAVSFVLVVAVIGVELRTRRLQETLTADCTGPLVVDEDEHWIGGILYYNPQDKRLVINDRTGMNSSFNLARPAGRIIMGFCVLLLLAMPLLGVWVWQEETSPVTLTCTDTALVASHAGSRWEIPLDEIQEWERLDEKPGISRIAGTGMDSVQKGTYASKWGNITVCLDPRTGPWLLVVTEEKTYLLGSSTAGDADRVCAALPAA